MIIMFVGFMAGFLLRLATLIKPVSGGNSLLIDLNFFYIFACRSNILSVPWIELGGKTSIICAKSGYVTNIEFKTKPFYNGKKDVIHAEVLGPNEKKPFLVVDGEWNDKMWAKWASGVSFTGLHLILFYHERRSSVRYIVKPFHHTRANVCISSLLFWYVYHTECCFSNSFQYHK